MQYDPRRLVTVVVTRPSRSKRVPRPALHVGLGPSHLAITGMGSAVESHPLSKFQTAEPPMIGRHRRWLASTVWYSIYTPAAGSSTVNLSGTLGPCPSSSDSSLLNSYDPSPTEYKVPSGFTARSLFSREAHGTVITPERGHRDGPQTRVGEDRGK